VAAQEVLRLRTEEEAEEDAPRIGQDHHEGEQRAHGTTDRERAEVPPIDLRLLAGKSPKPQVGLRCRRRSKPSYQTAEVALAAHKAARTAHLAQPTRRQPRMAPQRLHDERHEDIELRRARLSRPWNTAALQHAGDRTVMDAKLVRDRARRPLLGVEQAHDLRLDVGLDHHDCLRRAGSRDRPARAAPADEIKAQAGAGPACPTTEVASRCLHHEAAGRISPDTVSRMRSLLVMKFRRAFSEKRRFR
jgi:hypothetical protein